VRTLVLSCGGCDTRDRLGGFWRCEVRTRALSHPFFLLLPNRLPVPQLFPFEKCTPLVLIFRSQVYPSMSPKKYSARPEPLIIVRPPPKTDIPDDDIPFGSVFSLRPAGIVLYVCQPLIERYHPAKAVRWGFGHRCSQVLLYVESPLKME